MPHTLPYRVWIGAGLAHYCATYADGLAYLQQLHAQGIDTSGLQIDYVGPERRRTLRECYDDWLYQSPADDFLSQIK